MERWGRVAALASQQLGVVTAEQLGDLGFTRSAIRWGVSSQRLVKICHGVYRMAGTVPSWWQRAKAALLAAGPGAALSHDAAAYVLKLDGFEQPPEVIDVTLPGRVRQAVPHGVRLHLPRTAVRSFRSGCLEVTRAAHTLVDLAVGLGSEALELALDSAARLYPRVGEWLDELFREARVTPRGGGRLAQLLRQRRGQHTGSPLETTVWRALRGSGLPEARLQHRVRDRKGVVMAVDFAWPERRVALHVDGFRWHGRRRTFDDDARKRNRLAALGWTSVVVTSAGAEGEWLRALAAALGES